MRHLFPLLLLLSALFTLALPGCEPKEEILQTSGFLEFSADTVKFDTVFTTVRTVTKRLWAYNRNPRAVRVSSIRLANADGRSPYSLIINGDNGPAANEVLIRGNDSLQILVRAVLGDNGTSAQPKNFLVEDQVLFSTNGNEQLVRLLAYGQNIYFHNAETLPCNAVWRADKPHVVYNSVLVPAGCTLRILPGARVYSHAGSAIVVRGRLVVNDSTDFVPPGGPTDTVKTAGNRNIVRFQGDRLEPFYNDIPGQWLGIQIEAGSRDNLIRYADIKNASFGVLLLNQAGTLPRPDATVMNTVIRNVSGANLNFNGGNSFSGAGVLGINGRAVLKNTLLTNCGEYAVLGFGGSYALNYCTVANYTPSFRRETASLAFTNASTRQMDNTRFPLALDVRNSVVWGSIEDELFFENSADANYRVSVRNSLLRTKEYSAAAGTPAKPGLAVNDNLINVNPKFRRSPENAGNNFDYHLDATSPALDRATRVGPLLLRDLWNLPRNPNAPDLGAYERQ